MNGHGEVMRQEAVHPAVLEDLVARLRYKPGWKFGLEHLDRGQGSRGLTFTITVTCTDSYTGEPIRVGHPHPVPPAAYDGRSWRRWLFERIMDTERHEAMEFFRLRIDDGHDDPDGMQPQQQYQRPYAPLHKPGCDPYTVHELSTWDEVDTDFRGHRVHPETSSPPRSGAETGRGRT